MMYRTLSLLLAFALAVSVNATLVAADKDDKDDKNTHTGTFVSAKGNTFTMKDKDDKEHSHTLAKGAKVLGADGKAIKLADIDKGQTIRVTTKKDDKKVATKVEVLKKKG